MIVAGFGLGCKYLLFSWEVLALKRRAKAKRDRIRDYEASRYRHRIVVSAISLRPGESGAGTH